MYQPLTSRDHSSYRGIVLAVEARKVLLGTCMFASLFFLNNTFFALSALIVC